MADQYEGDYPEAENFLDNLDPEAPIGYSDIEGIGLSYDGDTWEIQISTGEWTYTVDLTDELPDWVWDELYYLADIYDWDWETSYA